MHHRLHIQCLLIEFTHLTDSSHTFCGCDVLFFVTIELDEKFKRLESLENTLFDFATEQLSLLSTTSRNVYKFGLVLSN